MERTRSRRIRNTCKSPESSLSYPSQLEGVAEEVPETASSGSVGSDSLYDLSLEKYQDSPPCKSPSTKSRQVDIDSKKFETDFERVPSSLGSDVLVDLDGNSNASSLFYLVISDESNDEETADSCPVSPDMSLDTCNESSLFSLPKKPLPLPERKQLLKFDSDNDAITKSLPSSTVEMIRSTSSDGPCLNANAVKTKRKPTTLPRRLVDSVTSQATSSSSTGLPSIASDNLIRKQHPKIMPKRSNSDGGIPKVVSAPMMTSHEVDKHKPLVTPRKRSPSGESVDTANPSRPPVPKPRRNRTTIHTVPSKPSNCQSPVSPFIAKAPTTPLSTFTKDFHATNVSWSAENSPAMPRKVHADEVTNIKQHLRPLSTCSSLNTPVSSKMIKFPKSASTDYLKGEDGSLIMPSTGPAIEMAPFEGDWQERFMQHKRRSKTMKYSGMMRVRSQLLEVKGTKS